MATADAKAFNERRAAYMREYRKKNPGYNDKQWIDSAKRILRKNGYAIVDTEKLRDFVEKLFSPNDPDCIGKQIIAEAFVHSEAARDEAIAIQKAAAARGLTVVGVGELFEEGGVDA